MVSGRARLIGKRQKQDTRNERNKIQGTSHGAGYQSATGLCLLLAGVSFNMLAELLTRLRWLMLTVCYIQAGFTYGFHPPQAVSQKVAF